jgi:hypothetical protein
MQATTEKQHAISSTIYKNIDQQPIWADGGSRGAGGAANHPR